MSFLTGRLSLLTRQPSFLNNLTNSMRALSVTPRLCQKTDLQSQNFGQIQHVSETEHEKRQEIFNKVNNQLAKHEEGRMFAVVHLCGKQFKITAGDIILVEGYWPPTAGDEIRLDKVLLAGAKDFTLIGTPILEQGVVDVKATIIEKTLSHTKTRFRKKRRKQFMRINFQRSPHTMIRINSIEVARKINEPCQQSLKNERIF